MKSIKSVLKILTMYTNARIIGKRKITIDDFIIKFLDIIKMV
mgnify:CR=1 FL=1